MAKIIRETSGKTGGDANGWKRGEKGYAKGGQWDKSAKPLAVDFDRAKQQGPLSGGGADGGFSPQNDGRGYRGVKS